MSKITLDSFLKSLNKAHLRYDDIADFFTLAEQWEMLELKQVGLSFEQRPINLISMGKGSIVVFAWTQMHGDEATATAAVFDLIAHLIQAPPENLRNWESQFTIHILPMLNPDGAERQTRQNAQGIDINRDALSLQSPEGRLLYKLAKDLSPTLGFNLHDQSPYYQSGTSGNPATIAFLAPAFNEDKQIDNARNIAMCTIAAMNESLQAHIPNCVARYNDSFSARSFGDNIAAMGVSTILIESGAACGDPNRQIARDMNVKSILSALEYTVLLNSRAHRYSIEDYFAIPENVSDAMSSLLIKGLNFVNNEHPYKADISIKQTARYSNEYYVEFVGDSGIQSGLEIFNAMQYCYVQGKVYRVKQALHLDRDKYNSLLKQAYLVFDDPHSLLSIEEGLEVCLQSAALGENNALCFGQAAYCLLANIDSPKHVLKAILNGKIVELP